MEFLNSCVPICSIRSQRVHDVPQVLNVLPKGVPNSTSLYSLSFAQSSPLLTYKGEPKGALYPHIGIAILGSFPSSIFLGDNQNGPLPNKIR